MNCLGTNFLLGKLNFLYIASGQFHQCSTSSFFTRRYQKHKKDWQLDYLFVLLGSGRIKDAGRMLMKFTPGVILTKLFSLSFPFFSVKLEYMEKSALTIKRPSLVAKIGKLTRWQGTKSLVGLCNCVTNIFTRSFYVCRSQKH